MIKKIIFMGCLIMIYCLLISHKINSAFAEKIDLNLSQDEIGIIMIDDENHFFLVKRNDENSLILFENVNEKRIHKVAEVFDASKINNLISNNEFKISYANKYSLNDKINLNYMHIKKSDNILRISFYDYNLCIYNDGVNDNLNDCTFIYFDDINNSLDIDDNNKVVFYSKDISEEFKEQLYTKWIDIYTIDGSNYTVLKIKRDNYNIINIPK